MQKTQFMAEVAEPVHQVTFKDRPAVEVGPV